jgi:hypothetical protein
MKNGTAGYEDHENDFGQDPIGWIDEHPLVSQLFIDFAASASLAIIGVFLQKIAFYVGFHGQHASINSICRLSKVVDSTQALMVAGGLWLGKFIPDMTQNQLYEAGALIAGSLTGLLISNNSGCCLNSKAPFLLALLDATIIAQTNGPSSQMVGTDSLISNDSDILSVGDGSV